MQTKQPQHFFHWMTQSTPTLFWHDSAMPEEIAAGVERGAMGVTCNPIIAQKCIQADPEGWAQRLKAAAAGAPGLGDEDLALLLVNLVVQDVAQRARPIYDRTEGRLGLVAAQVNPKQMDEAEPMIRQALEAVKLEPNLAVKVPATKAGMEVVEDLAAHGITTISTVSFSVAQGLAAQEAYERGRRRAKTNNPHALNYSVMIIGRLDEYLVKKTETEGIDIPIAIVEQAGLAVTKRLNRLIAERGYPGMSLTGGTRRRHIDQLAGARMCMTIGVAAQDEVLADDPPHEPLGDKPVDPETIERLVTTFPEFNQAFDEDGLQPDAFTSYGPCRAMHDWFVESFNETIAFVRANR